MKNILITGGLGYIGGRLANYLKTRRPNLNIFLTTKNKDKKLPQWTKEFTILQMNLLDEDSIANCLKNKSIDVIIHLAALNEIESVKDPELALEINTKGTYRLLNLANINNIDKFIYFSTFHVYGETSNLIISEESPTKPFHPYAITHRAAEDFVNYFQYYKRMKTLVLRLSNSYGYPMDKEIKRWTLVFNDFCKQVVTTGKIVLKSSGKQYRDFLSLCNVGSAVEHFLFIIPNKWEDGLYNLGGNCSMSILEVAQKISEIYSIKYKKEKPIIERKKDKDFLKKINCFTYNINKLMQTGWQLEFNIDMEIAKTMEVCEEFLK